jgi:hypothetical protein
VALCEACRLPGRLDEDFIHPGCSTNTYVAPWPAGRGRRAVATIWGSSFIGDGCVDVIQPTRRAAAA